MPRTQVQATTVEEPEVVTALSSKDIREKIVECISKKERHKVDRDL